MYNLKGRFLHATPSPGDTYFEGAIIFITEHNEQGAAGFVINKPFHRRLNELAEFSKAAAIDIFEGGPVDNEHLYFLHSDASLGGEPIMDRVFFGGDFQQAVANLSKGVLSSGEVKIFIGYCGWNAGELELEIGDNSWIVSNDTATSIFQ